MCGSMQAELSKVAWVSYRTIWAEDLRDKLWRTWGSLRCAQLLKLLPVFVPRKVASMFGLINDKAFVFLLPIELIPLRMHLMVSQYQSRVSTVLHDN